MKRVRKITRPFMYDLNQIPYDYTVEVRNRFKGLDLIEYLKTYGQRFMTVYKRCYSHAFRETDSLRRTMQIVKCSLLCRRAQGRVSS